MAGQGFAEAQVTWFGVVVPKGTPQQVVEQISKTLEAALAKVVKEAHYRRLRPRRRDFGQVIRFRTGFTALPGQSLSGSPVFSACSPARNTSYIAPR